jgi:hypothetical protein
MQLVIMQLIVICNYKIKIVYFLGYMVVLQLTCN